MGSIVDSEIQSWMPGNSDTQRKRDIILRVQDQVHETSPNYWRIDDDEDVKMELGPTVTEGPIFKHHVEVETNLLVETCPKIVERYFTTFYLLPCLFTFHNKNKVRFA